MTNKRETYLGDGVYVEGTMEHVILRTGSHLDAECDSKIYLDDSVITSLLLWLKAGGVWGVNDD